MILEWKNQILWRYILYQVLSVSNIVWPLKVGFTLHCYAVTMIYFMYSYIAYSGAWRIDWESFLSLVSNYGGFIWKYEATSAQLIVVKFVWSMVNRQLHGYDNFLSIDMHWTDVGKLYHVALVNCRLCLRYTLHKLPERTRWSQHLFIYVCSVYNHLSKTTVVQLQIILVVTLVNECHSSI